MTTDRRPLRVQRYSRKTGRIIGRLHYFRIVAPNGEIVAASEGYANDADRNETVELLRSGMSLAVVEDVPA